MWRVRDEVGMGGKRGRGGAVDLKRKGKGRGGRREEEGNVEREWAIGGAGKGRGWMGKGVGGSRGREAEKDRRTPPGGRRKHYFA